MVSYLPNMGAIGSLRPRGTRVRGCISATPNVTGLSRRRPPATRWPGAHRDNLRGPVGRDVGVRNAPGPKALECTAADSGWVRRELHPGQRRCRLSLRSTGIGFDMSTITDFDGIVGGSEIRGTAHGSDARRTTSTPICGLCAASTSHSTAAFTPGRSASYELTCSIRAPSATRPVNSTTGSQA